MNTFTARRSIFSFIQSQNKNKNQICFDFPICIQFSIHILQIVHEIDLDRNLHLFSIARAARTHKSNSQSRPINNCLICIVFVNTIREIKQCECLHMKNRSEIQHQIHRFSYRAIYTAFKWKIINWRSDRKKIELFVDAVCFIIIYHPILTLSIYHLHPSIPVDSSNWRMSQSPSSAIAMEHFPPFRWEMRKKRPQGRISIGFYWLFESVAFLAVCWFCGSC